MEKIFSKTSRYSTESVQTENLGIASPVPMGSWNKAIMYQKLNYVRHNQATYLAKKSNTNFEPGVATNWEDVWMLFNYDGGSVSPDGTYPNMTVGNSPKSLYNLGAFDTYVDNGDGTVTVTRKTGYYKIDGNFTANYIWHKYPNLISVKIPNVENQTDLVASIIAVSDAWNNGNPQYDYAIDDRAQLEDGNVGVRVVVKNATSMQEFRNYVSQHPISVEYELPTSEQYTEKLIAETPINTLDANMSDIVRDEVEKTLNLADWDGTEDYTKNQNTWTYLFIARLSVGVNYHLTIKNFSQNHLGHGGLFLVQSDTPNIPVPYQSLIGNPDQIVSWEYSPNGDKTADFTPSKEYVCLGIDADGASKTLHVEDIMLVEGSHAYPYQPYNGAIVHEIRTPLYFSTDNVSPASIDQIGGNWTSLGSFMVGSNTIYAWKKA